MQQVLEEADPLIEIIFNFFTQHLSRIGFRTSAHTKTQRYPSPLYKVAKYLHIAYAYLSECFKSSQDGL
jgi:hypothetical protein